MEYIQQISSGFQASFLPIEMVASTSGWTDRATSALLEALKTRERLWNTKSKSYKNKNTKKKHNEMVEILKDDLLLRFFRLSTT